MLDDTSANNTISCVMLFTRNRDLGKKIVGSLVFLYVLSLPRIGREAVTKAMQCANLIIIWK